MPLLKRLMPQRFAVQLALVVVCSMLLSQTIYTNHTIDEQSDFIEQVLRTQAQALAGNIAATASASDICDFAKSEVDASPARPAVKRCQAPMRTGMVLA
jgi:hypothetical protein